MAPARDNAWRIRSCSLSTPVRVMSPLATQRWLLITITRKPARLSSAMAWAAPGKKSICSQQVTYSPSGAFRLMTPSRSRNTAFCMFFMKDCLLYQFGKNVPDQDVALLNARRCAGRHTDAAIGRRPRFRKPSSRAAGQGHGVQLHFFRGRQRAQHIGGVAAGRDADGDIAGTPQGLDLPRKYQVKAVVVSDRGQA